MMEAQKLESWRDMEALKLDVSAVKAQRDAANSAGCAPAATFRRLLLGRGQTPGLAA